MGYIYCRKCGYRMSDQARVCPQCNTPVFDAAPSSERRASSETRVCPRCGKSLPLNAVVCSGCGHILKKRTGTSGPTHIPTPGPIPGPTPASASRTASGPNPGPNAASARGPVYAPAAGAVQQPPVPPHKGTGLSAGKILAIVAGCLVLLIAAGAGLWLVLQKGQKPERQVIVDLAGLFGYDREKIVFEFDEEGRLLSPRQTLVDEFYNDQLRCYTFDMREDVEGEGGMFYRLEQTFSFDRQNQLVAYDEGPERYVVEYKGKTPVRSIGFLELENYCLILYDGGRIVENRACDWQTALKVREEFQARYMTGPFTHVLDRYWYPVAERIWLRQTPDQESESNKITLINYNTRLLYLSSVEDARGRRWAYVRMPDNREGYVSQDYIWDEKDYIRFHSVFGRPELRANIPDAVQRRGLLDILIRNHMIGVEVAANQAAMTRYFNPNCTRVYCNSVELNGTLSPENSISLFTINLNGYQPMHIAVDRDGDAWQQ